ncbi:MAG: extracellular solute-binding protein, partial [Bacteroidota bacterium]
MSSRGLVQRTLVPLLALVVLVATGVTGVPALARTNLSIAALGGTGYQKVQDTLLQDYQAANPDVKVTIQYLSWDEIQSKLLVSIAGGVVPDIVMLPT